MRAAHAAAHPDWAARHRAHPRASALKRRHPRASHSGGTAEQTARRARGWARCAQGRPTQGRKKWVEAADTAWRTARALDVCCMARPQCRVETIRPARVPGRAAEHLAARHWPHPHGSSDRSPLRYHQLRTVGTAREGPASPPRQPAKKGYGRLAAGRATTPPPLPRVPITRPTVGHQGGPSRDRRGDTCGIPLRVAPAPRVAG